MIKTRSLPIPIAVVGGIYSVIFASSCNKPGDSLEKTFVLQVKHDVIYVSQALVDFAKANEILNIKNHEDLSARLNERGLGDHWIGVTSASYANGLSTRSTSTHYPAKEPKRFDASIAVLKLIQEGKVFYGYRSTDLVSQKCILIPEDFIHLDPDDAISMIHDLEALPASSSKRTPLK